MQSKEQKLEYMLMLFEKVLRNKKPEIFLKR